jgi:hypothetical protein
MYNQFSMPAQSGKPSLASAEVVTGLVDQFFADVLKLRADYSRGLPSAANPKQELLSMCKRYGDVFEGNDPSYDRPEWGNMTVAWMRHFVAESGDAESLALVNVPMDQAAVGQAFFLLVAKMTMKVSDSVAEGLGKDRATATMRDIGNRVSALLMGMQP